MPDKERNRKIRYCPQCKATLGKTRHEGYSRLACPKCGWINYENPLPSVAALVRNPRNEILLVKRGVEPSKGRWALPCGFIEIEETPEEACLRELWEEAGVKGKIVRFIGLHSQDSKLYKNVLVIGYEVEAKKGTPRPGSDSEDVKFVPYEKLPPIPFSSHRRIIEKGMSNPRDSRSFREVLKSKIQKAVIKKTTLFYEGSIGIDASIMEKADLLPGEKVQVLNYNNGERLETYVIKEKRGSGAIVLYGPAARKGRTGDEICVLSYILTDTERAEKVKSRIVLLDGKNRIRSE